MQALLNTGNVGEALGIAAAKIPAWPPSIEIASWVPYAMNYLATTTTAASLEAHTRFGRTLGNLNRAVDGGGSRPHANPPAPDRTLRIGLVSPDFRVHSVAFFIEPLLEHADRSRMHLTCYSTSPTEDAVTLRLKSLADQWRPVCAKIVGGDRGPRSVGPDRRIGRSRRDSRAARSCPSSSHRPAPVQVTYLGYPNTTGVEAIGYRIVDSHTDPPGADAWCTERLLRLDPCFLCYKPPPHSPEPITMLPSAATGHVTFGSFNTLIKLSDATVELWARVLDTVQGSRLLLKCRQLADRQTRSATIDRFVRAGVDPARLEVLPATKSLADHLALYARVDVGLDPTPYAGTTTTCEAMWMGVPVVTLAGESHASRVGVSLLTNVGLENCIARSPESFASAAAALAANHPRRGVLRSADDHGLRRRMVTSALCDGPGFAKRFEACLRTAWADWCRDRRAPA
jgi:protein O-GlcNAc transferase